MACPVVFVLFSLSSKLSTDIIGSLFSPSLQDPMELTLSHRQRINYANSDMPGV